MCGVLVARVPGRDHFAFRTCECSLLTLSFLRHRCLPAVSAPPKSAQWRRTCRGKLSALLCACFSLPALLLCGRGFPSLSSPCSGPAVQDERWQVRPNISFRVSDVHHICVHASLCPPVVLTWAFISSTSGRDPRGWKKRRLCTPMPQVASVCALRDFCQLSARLVQLVFKRRSVSCYTLVHRLSCQPNVLSL